MPDEIRETPMKNPEESRISSAEERPVSEWSFREVKARGNQLLAKAKKTQAPQEIEEIEEMEREFADLRSRREILRIEIEEVGGFEDLRQNLKNLMQMAAEGDLTARDIRDELKYASQISQIEDKTDSHAGMREEFYRAGLKFLREDLKKGKLKKGKQGEENLLARIADAVEASLGAQKRMAGEETEDLPKDKKEQRKKITRLLEIIESNDLPLAPVSGLPVFYGDNLRLAGKLMSWIERGKLDEALKREVLARLRLHHCAAVAAAIPPRYEDAAGYLLNLFAQPESQKFALEGEDFSFLFNEENEKIHGLRIREAWDILQTAATEGLKISGKGESIRYLGKSMPATTKLRLMGEIERKLARKISRNLGEEEKIAKKSLQLAERLAIATREVSVWNADLQGVDPLAEAIYFRKYRKSRAARIRDRGPNNTIHRIEGFGSSFLRFTKDIGGEYLAHSKNIRELSDEPDAKKRIDTYLGLNRAPAKPDGDSDISQLKLISPGEINYRNLGAGAYMGYLSSTLTRIFKTKDLLLKTTWKPEEFRSDFIESWVAPFDTADPEQVTRLKTEFLLGAFYAIFSRSQEALDLHWDNFALRATENNLLRTYTTEEGDKVAFLTPSQWKWIKKSLRKGWRININHQAAMVGVMTKITKRVI